jgi:AraC-like DNA-binding protein
MKKKRLPRIVVEGKSFGMPLVKSLGYDNIVRPIPLPLHKHRYYELTFIISGEVFWELPDISDSIHLTGDMSAIIQPDTRHKGKWDIIQPAAFFWIVVDPEGAADSESSLLKKGDIAVIETALRTAGNSTCRMGAEIRSLLEMLLDAIYNLHSGNRSTLAAAYIRNLVSAVILKSSENFSRHTSGKEQLDSEIQQAVVFMEKNINLNISVAEIAEITGLSSASFSKHFKKSKGITPAQYFSRMKCNKARDMLSETDDSITEISFSLGFSTTQYFADVFKKYTGMSPAKYRTWSQQNSAQKSPFADEVTESIPP